MSFQTPEEDQDWLESLLSEFTCVPTEEPLKETTPSLTPDTTPTIEQQMDMPLASVWNMNASLLDSAILGPLWSNTDFFNPDDVHLPSWLHDESVGSTTLSLANPSVPKPLSYTDTPDTQAPNGFLPQNLALPTEMDEFIRDIDTDLWQLIQKMDTTTSFSPQAIPTVESNIALTAPIQHQHREKRKRTKKPRVDTVSTKRLRTQDTIDEAQPASKLDMAAIARAQQEFIRKRETEEREERRKRQQQQQQQRPHISHPPQFSYKQQQLLMQTPQPPNTYPVQNQEQHALQFAMPRPRYGMRKQNTHDSNAVFQHPPYRSLPQDRQAHPMQVQRAPCHPHAKNSESVLHDTALSHALQSQAPFPQL